MQGKDKYDSHAIIKISCCCLQDATMTVPCNATISSASKLRSSTESIPKTACTSSKTCTLPKASTLSMLKMAFTTSRASMASMPKAKEVASVEEGHNKPLAKEGDDKPLVKDDDWLSTAMSPLPQGQLAMYIMQDSNKHLATRTGDRVHHARRQQAALWLRTPCKAMTIPSPQKVTGPHPSMIVNVPKRSQLN